jgi:hypothetical protein
MGIYGVKYMLIHHNADAGVAVFRQVMSFRHHTSFHGSGLFSASSSLLISSAVVVIGPDSSGSTRSKRFAALLHIPRQYSLLLRQ